MWLIIKYFCYFLHFFFRKYSIYMRHIVCAFTQHYSKKKKRRHFLVFSFRSSKGAVPIQLMFWAKTLSLHTTPNHAPSVPFRCRRSPRQPPSPPPPLQGAEASHRAVTANPSEAPKEAAEVQLPRHHVGGPIQLDVEPERQGCHAPHGRVHGARGEVHRGHHVRHRAPPEQAPVRDGLAYGLRPLHTPAPLGPLVRSLVASKFSQICAFFCFCFFGVRLWFTLWLCVVLVGCTIGALRKENSTLCCAEGWPAWMTSSFRISILPPGSISPRARELSRSWLITIKKQRDSEVFYFSFLFFNFFFLLMKERWPGFCNYRKWIRWHGI